MDKNLKKWPVQIKRNWLTLITTFLGNLFCVAVSLNKYLDQAYN